MSQVQTAIHIGVREVAKPLWILGLHLLLRETFDFLWCRCIDFEDTLSRPSILVLFLKRLQMIALARLSRGNSFKQFVTGP
jgi:hypothetical protein